MPRKLIRLQGILCILIGLTIIFIELWWRKCLCSSDAGLSVLLSLLETIGIALIGFGFFGIILDSRDWREYFAARLREIVIEQDYLNGLDNDTLKSLQTKVMKAFFHDYTIDKEGSFLNYFHQNLHKYISEPYREDATMIVLMKEEDHCIEIEEKFQYSCRKGGGDIQKNARLTIDPGEYLSLKKVKIAVQYPFWHEKKGEWVVLVEKEVALESNKSFTLLQPLADFKGVDGLLVSVESVYTVSVDLFQFWQMAHPTRNFQISFSFPKEYTIQLKPLVLHPELAQSSINDAFAMVKYEGWMLPSSGVAWRFIKNKI